MSALDFLDDQLHDLDQAGLRRRLRRVDSAQDREITLDGRRVLNFCSNNYLGLAAHPVIADAAHTALRQWGMGAGASRLIVGNQRPHERAERQLAEMLGSEAALLFNSGYHANLGIIPALVGRGDTVFSDELNHASIIDACRLSRARVEVYRHADVEHLAEQLGRADTTGRRLIATDAVFSMDGDLAPLAELSQLARQTDSMLMVDEAHSVGVFGDCGEGLCGARGAVADIRMATLGKALGGFGAFAGGSARLREYLLNRSRTFVFTTGLPAVVVAAAEAAARIACGPEGTARRTRLLERVTQFAEGLSALGVLEPGAGQSPIFPIILGDTAQTMQCCETLLAAGIYAQGIRPPTVPPGTSRLRFALMADHTPEDVSRALEALESSLPR